MLPDPAEAPAPVLLPAVREDLRLYTGPRHRDGSPSWRILDPVRNQFFEIGWLEFELLARWSDNSDVTSLIEHVSTETPIQPTEEEVKAFIQFLSAGELLVPREREVRGLLRQRWEKSRKSWYSQAFHHYLFFRIPLVRPDKFLEATLPLVEVFYTRFFAVALALLLVVDLYLLMRDWASVTRSAAEFFSLKHVIPYALAATLSKMVHELGHAYTSKRYGVRVPAMGLAFLVMWPYLYTDTAETWKLSDRGKQLAIASAGMAAELGLAIVATFVWCISPDGAGRDFLFVLASSTWVMTLAINASPFMRFDGYFLLSDWLDFPNLHERGSACAKWWIRSRFFGLDQARPEPTLNTRQRGWLIAFAMTTWVYRFMVFLGIALLVYHFVVKVVGIFLMILEVVYFILKPVVSEVAYLWGRRAGIRIAWRPVLTVILLAMFIVYLVPIAHVVTAPALLRAETEIAVYPPFAARVSSVEVQVGQQVQENTILARLEAPELGVRWRQAEVSIDSVRAELQRTPASLRQQERRAVLEEQLAGALAEQQAVREEAARLEIRAGGAGEVRDMAVDLEPGRWVNPRKLLMRVVSTGRPLIEAYVDEAQVSAIQKGQAVRFYPFIPGMANIRGTVVSVDQTPSREVRRALLASVHGGDIAAVVEKQTGALTAYESVFRVQIRPDSDIGPVASLVRGTVKVDQDLALITQNFLSRLLSIVVRESGF